MSIFVYIPILFIISRSNFKRSQLCRIISTTPASILNVSAISHAFETFPKIKLSPSPPPCNLLSLLRIHNFETFPSFTKKRNKSKNKKTWPCFRNYQNRSFRFTAVKLSRSLSRRFAKVLGTGSFIERPIKTVIGVFRSEACTRGEQTRPVSTDGISTELNDVDLKTDYPLVESIELSVRAGGTTKDYRRYSRRLLFSPFRERSIPARVEGGRGTKLPQMDDICLWIHHPAPCSGYTPAPLIIPRLNSLREMITRTPWKIEAVHACRIPLGDLLSFPSFSSLRFVFDSIRFPFSSRDRSRIIRINRRVFKRKTGIYTCNIIEVYYASHWRAMALSIDTRGKRNDAGMILAIDRPFEYTDNRLSNLYRELRSEGVK